MSDDVETTAPAPFHSLLGPEPAWLTCPCGAMTSRVPCWTCTLAAEAAANRERQESAANGSIPARYSWARLSAPDLAKRVGWQGSLKTASERILGAARVVFSGPSGSGKTSLAVACLRERGPFGLFVSALRLGTARIQAHAGQGEADLVERAIAAPLLLLDEVGGETKTATNAVRDVVFARHDEDRPTWITTGFKGQELAAMYGDGFLRRVTEGALVVKLGKGAP